MTDKTEENNWKEWFKNNNLVFTSVNEDDLCLRWKDINIKIIRETDRDIRIDWHCEERTVLTYCYKIKFVDHKEWNFKVGDNNDYYCRDKSIVEGPTLEEVFEALVEFLDSL